MHRGSLSQSVLTIFVAVVFSLVPNTDVLGQCELDTVNASDAAPHDFFGSAVAIDGDVKISGRVPTEQDIEQLLGL